MDKNLQENMPIYVQIVNKVREAIASGELAPGERVPAIRELAAEFEVNPNTMQRALTELEREGLLLSRRTSGRFVTEDAEKIRCLKTELAEDAADKFKSEMARLGFTEQEIIEKIQRCRCQSCEYSLQQLKSTSIKAFEMLTKN